MSRVSPTTKKQTQTTIVTVSEKLFMQHGYEQTTTKMIAKECGIAEGTIFNYFKSKDDILITIFEHHMTEDLVMNNTVSVVNLSDLIKQLLKPFYRLKKIPKVMMLELIIISVKKIKKKPRYLDRFAAMDYRYMQQIAHRIKPFIKQDTLANSKLLSEIIYGTFFVEFMMYLYEKEMIFEAFEDHITQKIFLILKPYLEVKKNDN